MYPLNSTLARSITLATLGIAISLPSAAYAAFWEDSKASLKMRNFYMNRDFRDSDRSSSKQSYREEWAQGFILSFESGYTEGAVGFGIDGLGLLGVKLDSSAGRAGTDLLPVHNDGDPADEYSKLGLTLKMKYSATEAKAGTFIPKRPTVVASDSRLLPQTFRGYEIIMNEFEDITLEVGRYTRTSARDAAANEQMTVNNRNMTGIHDTDKFDFAGVKYKPTKNLTLGYDWANLDNNYHQHYFTLKHKMKLGTGKLTTDLRFADSSDDGDSNVDNRAFGLKLTYALDGHKFGAGYQSMSGDTGFAYIGGTNPYLINYIQINHFGNADEKSYQLRYDYDFAAIGIPGLTFMTRYVNGYDMKMTSKGATEEWERNTDIKYVFQSGSLKGVGVRWRNATFRGNGNSDDADGNRLIVSYTLPLM